MSDDPFLEARRLATCGEWARVDALLSAAPSLSPHGQWLLSQARLAVGDLAGAWPLLEARKIVAPQNSPSPPFPEWQGEDLAGKRIVVWAEQGFGDQIQFARFIPLLRERAAEVFAAVPVALARLFSQLGAQIVSFSGGALKMPSPDVFIHPMSIPGRLGVREASFPAAPYLTGAARTKGGVGVCWGSNSAIGGAKSLSPETVRRLLAMPGAVSLDPNDTGAGDFQDTADVIAGLDQVISVDTAVAHLAGAMGKPVTLLLPASGADPRWGTGDTTPWYPTMTIRRAPADSGPS